MVTYMSSALDKIPFVFIF